MVPDNGLSRPAVAGLVRRIHATPTEVVLAVAGGGSRAISALLEVPGASRTVLEAVVPYAAESLAAWLGAPPEQHCAERTARAMAMAALERARRYAGGRDPAGPPLAGIACTASLASERPKRGPHRIYAALQTAALTASCSLELVKGRRSRAEEEDVAAALVLNLVAEACQVAQRLEPGLALEEDLQWSRATAPDHRQDLVWGRVQAVREGADPAAGGPSRRRAIFPGAFNPRHAGHEHMAQVAATRLGLPVEFEIAVANVDKPPLDFVEMERRAGQFSPGETLWFTRAATFLKKSEIFSQSTFIVGADTIARIADPRYYGDDPAACREAIAEIAARGGRFLVFGRRTDAGFQTLEDLDLPEELARICDPVPAAEFRLDISSTELRKAGEE